MNRRMFLKVLGCVIGSAALPPVGKNEVASVARFKDGVMTFFVDGGNSFPLGKKVSLMTIVTVNSLRRVIKCDLRDIRRNTLLDSIDVSGSLHMRNGDTLNVTWDLTPPNPRVAAGGLRERLAK